MVVLVAACGIGGVGRAGRATAGGGACIGKRDLRWGNRVHCFSYHLVFVAEYNWGVHWGWFARRGGIAQPRDENIMRLGARQIGGVLVLHLGGSRARRFVLVQQGVLDIMTEGG